MVKTQHSKFNIWKLNSIKFKPWIEVDNRTKSNTEFCVRSISEPTELNLTQSNRLCLIKYGE